MTKQQRLSYVDSIVRCRSLIFDLKWKINNPTYSKRLNLIYRHLEKLESILLHAKVIDPD